jgi:hypothetical protein
MRRRIIIAAAVLLVGIVSVPAHAGVRADVRHSAKVVYRHAAKRLGARALGRNIARHGVLTPAGRQRPASVRELRSWRSRLVELIRPPVAPRYTAGISTAAGSPVAVGPADSSRNTAGLPACADESHGDYSTGPANTNASGATGRWQEMPMHRARGGVCEGLDLSPAGQDACAARIYAAQGAGAWTGCG